MFIQGQYTSAHPMKEPDPWQDDPASPDACELGLPHGVARVQSPSTGESVVENVYGVVVGPCAMA